MQGLNPSSSLLRPTAYGNVTTPGTRRNRLLCHEACQEAHTTHFFLHVAPDPSRRAGYTGAGCTVLKPSARVNQDSPVGIEVAGPAYWSSQWTWINVMAQSSSGWWTQRAADRWVKKMPIDQASIVQNTSGSEAAAYCNVGLCTQCCGDRAARCCQAFMHTHTPPCRAIFTCSTA